MGERVPAISDSVVIMSRAELKARVDGAYQQGVKRGHFEEAARTVVERVKAHGPLTIETVGPRIRRTRELHKVSLRGAARQIGLSPTTLSRIERGADGTAAHYFAALNWVAALSKARGEDNG